MIAKALVVTRHPGLVEYLRNISLIGADAEVITHAEAKDVEFRHVVGVLPHNLSCLTLSFTEVPLNMPADMRGKELTAEDVARYAGEPVTYVVCRMKNPAGGFEALTPSTQGQLRGIGVWDTETLKGMKPQEIARLKKKARQEVLDFLA